jgi:hypothetical protein
MRASLSARAVLDFFHWRLTLMILQESLPGWRQSALALSALTVALLTSTSGTALAQEVPVEIEGPIDAIECLDPAALPPDCDQGDPAGVLMTVMGIQVQVPEGTPIASPTRSLNSRLLSRPARLPGRRDRGFVGGTGIIIGRSTVDGVIADDVFVEPAENVILGEITANNPPAIPVDNEPSGIELQGVPIVFLHDNRMAFDAVKNTCGFEVDQASLVDEPASVEGYLGQLDDNFYAFLMEVEGGTLVEPGLQVSITRARCDGDGGRLEVLGCGTVTAGDVRISAPGQGIVARADLEAGDPGFGAYRARVDVEDLPGGVCPSRVSARLTVGGETATAAGDVEVR